ncbi:MAG: metal-dependent hydrolase [Vicinamibacterales bacterium]|nr:metal-dependent hydrolase [Vicinamibacterales bacterium]
MASPIGHALAGIAVAWGADLVPGIRSWRTAPSSASWYERAGAGLTLTCAVLAAAPDLDLFFGRFHRTVTHSLISVAVVAGVAALVAARARLPRLARGAMTRIVIMCAGAWATHLLLDWLTADRSTPRGIQLLWPFEGRWFISGWDIFPGSERRQLFSAATMRRNVEAIVQDVAILMPIVVALWLVRVKALAGLSSQLARGHHPSQ